MPDFPLGWRVAMDEIFSSGQTESHSLAVIAVESASTQDPQVVLWLSLANGVYSAFLNGVASFPIGTFYLPPLHSSNSAPSQSHF